MHRHAIQTSGNTVRNVTADHFAGAAADEIEDPRVFDVRTVPERVRDLSSDPWADYEDSRAAITQAHMATLGIRSE